MKQHAKRIFEAGIQAVAPGNAVKQFLKLDGNSLVVEDHIYDLSHFNGITVVGAGKACAPMAKAVESIFRGRILNGFITTKYHHSLPLNQIRLKEAGHPVPDENGLNGAHNLLKLVRPLRENNLVLCLLSGGGSALLPLPAKGLTLQDKQMVTELLLAAGIKIEEINTVRKHLSSIKGGRLAKAIAPATLITFALSDVIGDRLDLIASGPTVPDPTYFKDAIDILERYELLSRCPTPVIQRLRAGQGNKIEETPKSGDLAFQRTQNIVVGSNTIALRAAEKQARALGYHTYISPHVLEGETREVACTFTQVARKIHQSNNPVPVPACILSGGETTVTMKGKGKGGRNQEFALAAATVLEGLPDTLLLSAGTDGADGPTDAAGAFVDGTTLSRSKLKKLDSLDYLLRNDSYHFFKPLGDLFVTGPTYTNVMDIQILLVGKA